MNERRSDNTFGSRMTSVKLRASVISCRESTSERTKEREGVERERESKKKLTRSSRSSDELVSEEESDMGAVVVIFAIEK
jgi:hypothetical protein